MGTSRLFLLEQRGIRKLSGLMVFRGKSLAAVSSVSVEQGAEIWFSLPPTPVELREQMSGESLIQANHAEL